MAVLVASIVATAILCGLVVFQLLLAMGAPWGRYAWGGAHQVLPRRLRIASIVAVPVYALMAAIILSRADTMQLITNRSITDSGIWALTALFGIGVIMNAASRSKVERLWVPVVLVLCVSCFIIARS